MKPNKSMLAFFSLPQKYPVLTTVMAALIVLLTSWAGYGYHVAYHRFFGSFTPHEKYLCREEPLMLQLQKLMLLKAKKEVAYMIARTEGKTAKEKKKAAMAPGQGAASAAAAATAAAAPEKAVPEKTFHRLLFDRKTYTFQDPDSASAAAGVSLEEVQRIKSAQAALRLKHADKQGPAHPTLDIHDHKQVSKVKGLQHEKQPTLTEPHSRVFVSNDLGFYQFHQYAMPVETESGSTLIGQAVGTHSRVGNGFNTIVYYGIWKNANDYIRGLLYQFSRKKIVRDGTKPVCTDLGNCQHLPRMQTRIGNRVKNLFFNAHLRRFPFTFVRNPFTKFVSGYTEVEWRYQQAHTEREWWNDKKKKEQQEALDKAAARNATVPLTFSHHEARDRAAKLRDKAHQKRQASALSKVKASKESKAGQKSSKAHSVLKKGKETAGYDQYGTKQDPHPDLHRKNLPLKAALGSPHRFLEFIDMILLFDGSRRIYRTYDQAQEMGHIAPQVGALFSAAQIEHLPLRMYKLENFGANWKLLSEETAQPRLLQVREVLKSHPKLWQHKSSDDEYGTSKAAWQVLWVGLNVTTAQLEAAEETERIRLHAVQVEEQELKKMRQRLGLPDPDTAADADADQAAASGERESRGIADYSVADAVDVSGQPFWLTLPQFLVPEVVYTRALCRIYLSDFVCTDYELPAVCQDMVQEIDAFTQEYESKQKARAWAHRSLANTLLPQWLLYILAEVPCSLFADSPPACIASFVHGEALEEEDAYDDYDSEHDEL